MLSLRPDGITFVPSRVQQCEATQHEQHSFPLSLSHTHTHINRQYLLYLTHDANPLFGYGRPSYVMMITPSIIISREYVLY